MKKMNRLDALSVPFQSSLWSAMERNFCLGKLMEIWFGGDFPYEIETPKLNFEFPDKLEKFKFDDVEELLKRFRDAHEDLLRRNIAFLEEFAKEAGEKKLPCPHAKVSHFLGDTFRKDYAWDKMIGEALEFFEGETRLDWKFTEWTKEFKFSVPKFAKNELAASVFKISGLLGSLMHAEKHTWDGFWDAKALGDYLHETFEDINVPPFDSFAEYPFSGMEDRLRHLIELEEATRIRYKSHTEDYLAKLFSEARKDPPGMEKKLLEEAQKAEEPFRKARLIALSLLFSRRLSANLGKSPAAGLEKRTREETSNSYKTYFFAALGLNLVDRSACCNIVF